MSNTVDFVAIRTAADRGEILTHYFVVGDSKCLMCWISEDVHKMAKNLYGEDYKEGTIWDSSVNQWLTEEEWRTKYPTFGDGNIIGRTPTPTSFCKEEVLPQWMACIVPQLTDNAPVEMPWTDIIDAVEKVHRASKEDREKIRVALTEEKLILPVSDGDIVYTFTSYKSGDITKFIDIIRSHQ
jgi:hypothetical protein